MLLKTVPFPGLKDAGSGVIGCGQWRFVTGYMVNPSRSLLQRRQLLDWGRACANLVSKMAWPPGPAKHSQFLCKRNAGWSKDMEAAKTTPMNSKGLVPFGRLCRVQRKRPTRTRLPLTVPRKILLCVLPASLAGRGLPKASRVLQRAQVTALWQTAVTAPCLLHAVAITLCETSWAMAPMEKFMVPFAKAPASWLQSSCSRGVMGHKLCRGKPGG